MIFFVGSIVVMSALIPYKVAGVTQSPFVYVLQQINIPFAADIMNFVVLTAIISAANSTLCFHPDAVVAGQRGDYSAYFHKDRPQWSSNPGPARQYARRYSGSNFQQGSG